ncbi:hypothetical protein SAMN04487948_10113 [Halogranum amylolyticum]|uniref:Uncharacterized protein n=1 Tax=Halogranum amylolyticum TaxID=660520 RepID=A0A1H8MPX2_9EURY|nr:hypothetical protein [Halogranum amylolyticum]SEO19359.1 hypothetical protein SAMN04487948_10113 [Halogranum amylolyticum]
MTPRDRRATRWCAHLSVAFCIASLLVGAVSATPPAPSDDNGLTENESATLWSHDRDSYINESTYQTQYNRTRVPIQQLANGTDISFTRPPKTAATWTDHDFEDLAAGDETKSIAPAHANLTDGVLIRDAHVSTFAIHPSTRGHLTPSETPLYIAPTGSLRALVDYRVRLPSTNNSSARNWTITSHEIEAVRLSQEETTIAQTTGHTPVLEYTLTDGGPTTLTIEADIAVTIDNGLISETETLTVSETLEVVVYDLTAYPHYTTYPDGDTGVAMFQNQPWQGYSLGANASVRGVWRFYTARDRRWDTLSVSTETTNQTVDSPALPVYVHAYPSRIGPRAEPLRNGPELIDVWGVEHASPNETLGSNVAVEVVEQPYAASYGVAVRTETVDRDELTVSGIVRGVNATIVDAADSHRTFRESNLTVTVVSQTTSEATLRIELRDNETSTPIALAEHPRLDPLSEESRTGYITIAGERVETNSTGVAFITVDQPGIYTATYHSGSWLSSDPAYTPASASARWHPLSSIDSWLVFVVEVVWWATPFLVALYAGQRVLTFLPGSRIDR